MEHFILTFFQTHFEAFKHFGYLVVFISALTESLPLLGMLIPGQTIIILVGFLVKLHLFNFWLAVIIAAFGALAGDYFGFIMGKYFGHHFTIAEKKFYIKREQFIKTKKLIAAHPFKSIFFGRLHSLTRTITPFAAGASEISTKRFLTIDFLSGFVWAFLSILIGFIFGKSFEKASSFIGSIILIATLITVCIVFAAQYAKKKNIKIPRVDMYMFISSSVSLYLFALIAQNIHRGQFFSVLDSRIYMLKNLLMTPLMTFIMIVFSSIGSGAVLTALCVVMITYLYIKKQKLEAKLSLIILGSGYLLTEILKIYFKKPRPLGLIDASGSSFPSGHSSMSMMFAVIATYFIFQHIKELRKKNALISIVFVTSCLIGLSRIYLGVHFISDVLAGFLLGIFYPTFAIVVYKGFRLLVKKAKQNHESPLP